MFEIFWKTVAVGIGGTVAMDVWAIILHKVFGEPRPNWRPVGRWVLYLPKGKVFHGSIANSAPMPSENAVGWAFHYFVGIVYAAIVVLIAGAVWLTNPTFLPALIVGLVTVGAAWFLLQPALGAGWFASKTPNPMKTRTLNIIGHIVFATGMYLTALLVASL